MKTIYIFTIAVALTGGAMRMQSQNKPTVSAGAMLLQMRAANANLLERQTATLEVLKGLAAESDQMRIVAKRK
jgi:hypothetical protein